MIEFYYFIIAACFSVFLGIWIMGVIIRKIKGAAHAHTILFEAIHSQMDKHFSMQLENLKIMESRLNEKISQAEIRLTNLISHQSSQQTEATWALREKLLLLEHKPKDLEERKGRGPGRPPKYPRI